jgi:hypothetical protein
MSPLGVLRWRLISESGVPPKFSADRDRSGISLTVAFHPLAHGQPGAAVRLSLIQYLIAQIVRVTS